MNHSTHFLGNFYMLEHLLGSKSLQNILLFLFVNQKCYGTQLSRFFNLSLTPLQNALTKLEKGRVLTSHYEGKTRVYQFNPNYPLLEELDQLLKKAYTLLPSEKKKMFHFLNLDIRGAKAREDRELLTHLWQRLGKVQQLSFLAKSRSQTGWKGLGNADVTVVKEGSSTLIFQEQGSWKMDNGEDIQFSNVFRWILDPINRMLSLEHLRFGEDRPVFLFYLVPKGGDYLESLDSHLCAEDVYFGQMHCSQDQLHFHWRIIGPKKNEHLEYCYT